MTRFCCLIVLATLAVAGCSGPSPTLVETSPRVDVDRRFDFTAAEDFDESPYADSMASFGTLEHDVPEALLRSEAAVGVVTERTVQGYRIQIHSSLERDSALRLEDDAQRWWRSLQPEDRPIDYRPDELPVRMQFVTPYYRVRVGGFESRSAAETFLGFLSHRYPDAFLVLDSITVYR